MSSVRSPTPSYAVLLCLVAASMCCALWRRPAHANSNSVVISQVYGGGGNSGTRYPNDFVELYNRGHATVDLSGWSVQYAPRAAGSWQVTPLTGPLAPGQHYLVQQAQGAGGSIDLPQPDAVGTTALSSQSGIVALVNTRTALPSGCPAAADVVDLVGYGSAPACSETAPAPGLSNTTAALRGDDGCLETDNNQRDFSVGPPNARNTQSPRTSCTADSHGPSDCSAPDTPIGLIQGTGERAALTGMQTIEGVVVADYEYPGAGRTSDYLRGFYVQNTPESDDDNPLTSDAIFIFNENRDSVSVGQIVQVSGHVSEYGLSSSGGTQTQVTASSIVICPGTGTIAPTDITFPLSSPEALERWEGMLIRIPQRLTVTEHYQLGRFGQVSLSAGGRLRQPTSVAPKGAAAARVQSANALRQILVDDALQAQNADPIRFARNGTELTAQNTLRGGDTITGLTGVLTQTDATSAFNASATTDPVRYRVRPFGAMGAQTPNFVATNPRPELPVAVDGSLKVASVNLLNYFNTFGAACSGGVGGHQTDCRGAADAAEFDRQWRKSVQAILATSADIVVLNELENDGYGPASALQDLIDKLNAQSAPGSFAFIDVDRATGQQNALGSDAIRVAMIYRPKAARPIGKTAVANTGAFGLYNTRTGSIGRNRPALAQAFEASGGRVIIVANHLKSKGSSCENNISPVGPDPDLGDGQGQCNLTRTAAVKQLVTWLDSHPTRVKTNNILVLGDFNAYAREDPIVAMQDGGYTNLVAEHIGDDAYSYVFDGQWGYLDYAFASQALASVASVVELHINADEPSVLDYNADYKTKRQLSLLYAPDAFRASDHDPIVVGLDLARAQTAQSAHANGGCGVRRPVGAQSRP